MSDAEDFCIGQGKHLASITTIEDENKVKRLLPYEGAFWLGGKRNSKQEPWQWLDGRKWGFEGKWEDGGVRGGARTPTPW